MLFGLFGLRVTALYMATGLVIAVVSGWVIGRLWLEKWVEDWVYQVKLGEPDLDEKSSFEARIAFGWEAVKDVVGKVWLYVVMGIAVEVAIRGNVPEDFMASFMGKEAWWSVAVAVILGILIYSGSASMIPVFQALMEKRAALGMVLALMMAVIDLSLPEMIILRKVRKLQIIATFVAVVGLSIVITGYLFNMVI